MLGLLLRPLARKDLFEIWFYIAEEKLNPSAADKVIRRIYQEFTVLQKSPKVGLILKEVKPETRRVILKNYIIFYQVTDTHIDIIRCIHGARNWAKLI